MNQITRIVEVEKSERNFLEGFPLSLSLSISLFISVVWITQLFFVFFANKVDAQIGQIEWFAYMRIF